MMDHTDLARLDVLDRLNLIEKKLKEQDPELPTHLASIHKTLLQYEELVHILPDEKIHTLMQGLAKHRGVKLVEDIAKARAPRKKQTADDF